MAVPAQRVAAAQTIDLPGVPLRLGEGIELLGQYQGSGFKEAPYLVRRPDGQMIQLPPLLYFVAERLDGDRDLDEIADEVTAVFGRGIDADGVKYLIEEKLQPLGILPKHDRAPPEIAAPDPLLALKLRTAVVPARVVNWITRAFLPLFVPFVMVATVAGLVVFDVWLFGSYGVAQGLRAVIYSPFLLFVLLGAVAASAAFHEIGHAAACRYGGGRPGVMGVGLYIVWPAFYTDVTDAYRLSKGGRLRTDVGGVYFNALFALVAGLVFFATHFQALLIVAVLVQLEILQQFLPFLRLDGYYMISDLTGVPDLFTRIGPVLRSLLPHRGSDPRVKDLKRRVRVAVTAWVFFLVPLLLFNFGVMLIAAPRVFATMWDSMGFHARTFTTAWHAHQTSLAAITAVQILVLALPALGIAYMVTRVGRRLLGRGWGWAGDSPLRRSSVVLASLAVAGILAFLWWPKGGSYEPIGRNERWTVPETFHAFGSAASGGGAFPVAPVTAPGKTGANSTLPTPGAVPPTTSSGSRPSASMSPSPSPASSASPSPSPSPSKSPSPSPSPSSSPSPSPSSSSTSPSPSPSPS